MDKKELKQVRKDRARWNSVTPSGWILIGFTGVTNATFRQVKDGKFTRTVEIDENTMEFMLSMLKDI